VDNFRIIWDGSGGVAYSFTQSIPVAIIILTISGFMNAPVAIGRRLVVQRNTPREMRGRVNSAFFVSRDILFLVGWVLQRWQTSLMSG